MAWGGSQNLPLRVQKLLLDQIYPGIISTIKKGTYTWEGWLQPSAVSQPYRIRLIYKFGGAPEVYLIEPDPQAMADKIIPGRRIPHIYGMDPLRLCLYLPSSGEWCSGDALAITIIPWTIMWLSFFEDWVFTDVWSGGGVHPEIEKPSAP